MGIDVFTVRFVYILNARELEVNVEGQGRKKV